MSNKLKSLLALSTLAIASLPTLNDGYLDHPVRKQREPESILNKPQKSKRNKRNKLAKQSRKQNRK